MGFFPSYHKFFLDHFVIIHMFIHCFLNGGALQEMKCSDDIENKKAFELPKLPAIMF